MGTRGISLAKMRDTTHCWHVRFKQMGNHYHETLYRRDGRKWSKKQKHLMVTSCIIGMSSKVINVNAIKWSRNKKLKTGPKVRGRKLDLLLIKNITTTRSLDQKNTKTVFTHWIIFQMSSFRQVISAVLLILYISFWIQFTFHSEICMSNFRFHLLRQH